MNTQWSPVKSKDTGVDRFRAGKSSAWIQHNTDGSVSAGGQKGLLGTRVESHFFAPAPSDSVILDKIDHALNPPRFDNWKKQDGSEPGSTTYKGKADNLFNSNVTATITRSENGGAELSAQVGWFGLQIEGSYFAPAPSDAEILKGISRRPE